MNYNIAIIPFNSKAHKKEVIDLWKDVFAYAEPHNEPSLVIKRKEEVNDELFFVSLCPHKKVTGTVMCGYDGHRGWIYSLAVLPELQRSGIGKALMFHAEEKLKKIGCMKINLQVLEGNESVLNFYGDLGYAVERRVSMGKQIKPNIPTATSSSS